MTEPMKKERPKRQPKVAVRQDGRKWLLVVTGSLQPKRIDNAIERGGKPRYVDISSLRTVTIRVPTPGHLLTLAQSIFEAVMPHVSKCGGCADTADEVLNDMGASLDDALVGRNHMGDHGGDDEAG